MILRQFGTTKGLPAKVWFMLLATVAHIDAIGQNYADRGYSSNSANIDLYEYEADPAAEEVDWNDDEPEVWRWNVEDFPHPQLETIRCRRRDKSNLCNPDQVLSFKEARLLDSVINSIYNQTSCICDQCDPWREGIQIGIAILKHVYKPYNETPSKVVQSFARNLRSKWRLGDCDDDILIVLVTEDRLSYTDVGVATSRYISKEKAYKIFLENKANFTQGKYYEGLKHMLEAFREAATTIPRKVEEPEVNMSRVTGIIFGVLLSLAVIAIVAIWIYRRIRKTKNSKEDTVGTESSTWKRMFYSFGSSLTGSKDTYIPCKTEDEIQTSVVDATSTSQTKTSHEDNDGDDDGNKDRQEQVIAIPIDQPDTGVSTNPPGDDGSTVVLKTFPQAKKAGLQQTDL